MRLRVLAAAAVAAWSKTAAATTASVLPGVLEQPAGASEIKTTSAATSCPVWGGPHIVPGLFGLPTNTVSLRAQLAGGFGKNGGGFYCLPGTASLQASPDQSQWKSLDTQHATSASVTLEAPCQPGTWWYRGFYVPDDHSFKSNSNPVALSC